MRPILILSVILITQEIFSIEKLRLKAIRFVYGSNGVTKIRRLNYDPQGNLNRVAQFNPDQATPIVEYYFYDKGCVSKILGYQDSKLTLRTYIKCDINCNRLLLEVFDAKGSPVRSRENKFSASKLKSFIAYDSEKKKAYHGQVIYSGERIAKVVFPDEDSVEELIYSYNDAGLPSQIRHTIIRKGQKAIENTIFAEYEDGIVTKESQEYIYQ